MLIESTRAQMLDTPRTINQAFVTLNMDSGLKLYTVKVSFFFFQDLDKRCRFILQ
jgi:hypothetical protein